ncbi:MAG: molybdenum cofactor biosynthesis protein MoaE [Thermoleophilia bacterium]|nr:molybdenum cofactor biosynthesis protein MoaE [Thermoleophilia bacterium]
MTDGPVSLDALVEWVGDPQAGAVVTFTGTTRTVARLEYEGYAEMARDVMADILARVAAAHGVIAIAAHHRLGDVPRGQAGVAIAASAAHRPEAFAATRAAIDLIKAEVPIWKREIDGDRAEWVRGTPVEGAR